MDKKKLRTLMTFVIDSNKQTMYDLIVKEKMQVSEKELRALIEVVDANTKNCFFKLMEKSEL
ncbi:MAG: hypothetical protein ACR2PE_00455 [Porticoccus sp.]